MWLKCKQLNENRNIDVELFLLYISHDQLNGTIMVAGTCCVHYDLNCLAP